MPPSPLAPLAPIPRPRLVARLVGARAAILGAPAGYGKSMLIDQAVEAAGIAPVRLDVAGIGSGAGSMLGAVRRAVRVAGLGALDASLASVAQATEGADEHGLIEATLAAVTAELAARPDPVLLAIDGLQGDEATTDGAGVALVAGLARTFGAPHPATDAPPAVLRVLVAGRAIPAAVRAALPDAVVLGMDELALDADEVEALLRASGRSADPVVAATLHATTGGWPAAVTLALAAGGSGLGGQRSPGFTEGLRALLAGLDAETQQVAAAVAHLPLVDAAVAEAVAGPGALERAEGVGLPFRRRPDGWLELAEPVRAVLRDGTRLEAPHVRRVADAYLDAAEPAVALAFLLAEGDPDTLAATLAGRSWHELTTLEVAELRAALTTLPEVTVGRHPRVLLAAARVAESGVYLRWRTDLLERARAIASGASDPVLLREVLAEQAADASRAGDEAASRTLANEVLRAAGSGEVRSRAVALTALGRIDAFERDPATVARAAEELAEAAALLRTLPDPEPDLLRGTLQVLGYGVHFARGDLDAAIAALREAADLVPGAMRTRAGVQTFLADALVAAGALDEAESVLREVLGVARRLRDDRLLGYHAWMQAGIASRRGDAAAVEAWLVEAERHPADWFAHPTGIEFLADAVDHLGRVGEHAEAARYLARVEARCAADPWEAIGQIGLVARAIFAARAGDPDAAERDLVTCLSIEQVPPREHWRIHLLRAYARLRTGDPTAAVRLARRASLATEAMGHPGLPRILEPEIAARLAALVEGDATSVPTSAATTHLRLLGGFGITVDGRAADLPEGRPRQLVKLLAVTGRPMPIDEAVEVLWPDVDGELGRQRLRNVLTRVRTACGDLVVRDEETLRLDPAVEVDLARFEAEAASALASAGGSQEAAVRAALARYAGELLPGDRYADFTLAARERAALRHLALLDRLGALAAARGDIDEALALAAAAIDAEPLDERRYRAAIDLALRHGRRDRARHLVERALAVDAELADEPSPELLGLARSLGLRPR